MILNFASIHGIFKTCAHLVILENQNSFERSWRREEDLMKMMLMMMHPLKYVWRKWLFRKLSSDTVPPCRPSHRLCEWSEPIPFFSLSIPCSLINFWSLLLPFLSLYLQPYETPGPDPRLLFGSRAWRHEPQHSLRVCCVFTFFFLFLSYSIVWPRGRRSSAEDDETESDGFRKKA